MVLYNIQIIFLTWLLKASCEQDGWKRHRSLVSPLHNNMAYIHRQKCLCGRCGVQHHMLRDSEEVSLTHVSGNRHTYLAPAVVHELAPAPLSHNPGVPGEHCLRQSLTDERALEKVQISIREVPTHCWSKKKYKFGCIRKGRRTIWHYT